MTWPALIPPVSRDILLDGALVVQFFERKMHPAATRCIKKFPAEADGFAKPDDLISAGVEGS
jgi:hypothetical protein